jgi:hypothetical protein
MSSTHPWYVAVDDTTVGPAATDLVIRGIEHRKIPPEALVCPVGTGSWRPLASVQEFHAAVVRSYPPPPLGTEEERSWLAQGFHFPAPGALPQFALSADAGDDDWDSDTSPSANLSAPELESAADEIEAEDDETAVAADDVATVDNVAAPSAAAIAAAALDFVAEPEPEPEADLEVELEPDLEALAAAWVDPDVAASVEAEVDAWGAPAVDWSERFQSYFLVGDEVELPEEQALLESLRTVPHETFRHEEALWNLALCLAFGSDAVGEAAGRTFFAAVAEHGSVDRLEWMSRTLLGNGFVPSGIPAEAGRRGCERLRSTCPPPAVLYKAHAASAAGAAASSAR